MSALSPGDTTSPQDALEKLAATLDSRYYQTSVVRGHEQMPSLSVVSRHAAQVAKDIYARHGWYWWSWAERIAPVADVPTAASKVAAVLRTVPGPSHGLPSGQPTDPFPACPGRSTPPSAPPRHS